MTRAGAVASGLLAVALCLLPLARGGPVPLPASAAAAALLGGLAVGSALLSGGRLLLALALTGWIGAEVAVGHGPVLATVLVLGPGLRLWSGLPELVRLGRPGLADLATDLVGGAAACGLVLAVSDRTEALPPGWGLLAALAGVLLLVPSLLRLRR